MPLIDLPLAQLRTYAGINPRPEDHDAYWQKALAEMRAVEPSVELIEAEFQTPFAACFHLYFTGVRGARIHAKYLRPRRAAGPHPALVEFHGYTSSSGDWSSKLGWVGLGYSIASLDCRGQGGLSQDTGGVLGPTLQGHFVRGLLDDPENRLFRQIFLDTAQLASIVMAFDEVDAGRVGALGGSQGGALTLACAALEPRIKRAAPTFPFLCDYQRVWEMDLAEGAYAELKQFFRNHDPLHARERDWFTRLGYIDIQHLAPRIEAEVLMGVGLMDQICPPSTQYAAYNKIRAPKRELVYPDFGHEHLPGFSDEVFRFLSDL